MITEILINNIKKEIEKRKEKDFALCIEQWKQVLDYITNLQQENKRLLKKSYKDDVIITKAIKFIKSTYFYGMRSGRTLIQKYLCDLIKILQGSD